MLFVLFLQFYTVSNISIIPTFAAEPTIPNQISGAYPVQSPHLSGVDNSKMRIWLRRGHFGNFGDVVINYDNLLVYPSGYVFSTIFDDKANQHYNYHAYFDIPKTTSHIRFLKIPSDRTTIWETSTTHTISSGDNSKLFHLPDSDQVTETLSTYNTIPFKVTNYFIAKVLEGYLTCSNDSVNGYGAFPEIDSHLIPKTTENGNEIWNVDGNIDVINISDYNGSDGYTVGEYNTSNTGVQVNAQAKYDALLDMYTNNTWTRPISSNPISKEANALLNFSLLIMIATFSGTIIFKKFLN